MSESRGHFQERPTRGGERPYEGEPSGPPPAGDEMIEPDADPIDTEVEDADFFLGEEGGGEDA